MMHLITWNTMKASIISSKFVWRLNHPPIPLAAYICAYFSSLNHFTIFNWFRCAACHKCFLTSNKLKYHIRRTHLPADGSFFCSVCDKECKNLRLLLNHQKSHIQINCPHCKKYITASNYEHHVRTIHACVPTTKRKPTARADVITSKKRIGENPTQQSSSSKMMHPSVRVRSFSNHDKSYFC